MENSADNARQLLRPYKQLSVRHDKEQGVVWYFMEPRPRPCFTQTLLDDIRQFQIAVDQSFRAAHGERQDLKYIVLASARRDQFNLGGDLALFEKLIRTRDRRRLARYARACIDVLYLNSVALNLPITTISLVRGSALGGGFEAALSSQVLIAERSAQMGFPEILFNLFPGMGAYSLLNRRLDAARAERLILSGRTYSAVELYEMGVVDVLAENGAGREAVENYVRKQIRFRNGTMAVHRVREFCNPVTYDELLDIALLWVDASLRLKERDLRVMDRLVRAQNRKPSEHQWGQPKRRSA